MKHYKVCRYPQNPCDAKYDFYGIYCCGEENKSFCTCALLFGHFTSHHMCDGEHACAKNAGKENADLGVAAEKQNRCN